MTPLNDPTHVEPLPRNAALVVIDMQLGFDDPRWGERNNPALEANVEALLWAWRWTHRPIFHIQHRAPDRDSPFHVRQPGHAFKPAFCPLHGERLIKKRAMSAFVGTDLKVQLRKHAIDMVVVAGLVTDRCVSATARMAGDYGFDTLVVTDGTAAFGKQGLSGQWYAAETIHDVALANLRDEFATILDVETAYARALAQERRHRASLVIVRDGHVLLLHRWKRGREYFAVPGGGIEPGETVEQAAVREAKEETGLDIVIDRPLWSYAGKNHHFLVTQFSGDLCMTGPEQERVSADNRYQLEWVPLTQLPTLSLSPAPVGAKIVRSLAPEIE